jgi:DNA-directed RNA polymerase subunit F
MSEKILSEKDITIPEVKELLENKGELNQFQIRTLNYSSKFSKIESSKAKELVDKLVENFNILRVDAVQLVNCMPKSVAELRVFFATSKKKVIMTSRLKEILKFIDKYR